MREIIYVLLLYSSLGYGQTQVGADGIKKNATLIQSLSNRLGVDTVTYCATKFDLTTISGGGGTVTSVGSGLGLLGGVITASGVLSLDTGSTVVLSRQRAVNTYYPLTNPNGYTNNTGTVTSVSTGLGLSGGAITTTGTLLVDTSSASILSRQRAANTYQPIGSYLTSVDTSNIANFYVKVRGLFSATSPLVYSGGNYSMAASNGLTNGYLSSGDWSLFNGKQDGLISGTNIKTVNGVTLLGGGNLAVGIYTGISQVNDTTAAISKSSGTADTLIVSVYSATQKAGSVLITANRTLLLTDFGTNGTVEVFADATSGAITVTLPTCSSYIGMRIIVIKTDGTANNVIIDGSGSETINGSLTNIITAQYSVKQLGSNGTTSYIF